MTLLGLLFIAAIGFAFSIALLRPWFCFVLVCCFMVIEGTIQSYVPFFANDANRPLINYTVALLAGFTVVIRIFREPGSFRNAINPVLIIIVCIAIFSYFGVYWSSDESNGMTLTRNGLPYSILYIIVTPLLISTLPELSKVRIPFIFIATGALGMLLMSPNVRFEGERLVNAITSSESTGVLSNGELGVMVFVFVALTTFDGAKKAIFPVAAAAGFLGLGMGFYTGARGQVIAGIVVILLCYPLARRVKSFGGFITLSFGFLIFLTIVIVAVQFFITGKNVDRWSLETLASAGGRGDIVSECIASFLKNPSTWLFGQGSGSFMSLGTGHAYPHNHGIELLMELGLIGFSLYVLMVGYLFWYGLTLFQTYRDDSEMRPVVALLIGICLFVFIISLKQGSVHNAGNVFYWYLILGRLGARNLEDGRLAYLHDDADVDDDDDEQEELDHELEDDLQHA